MANVYFDETFTTKNFHDRVREEFTLRAPQYNSASGGTPITLRTSIIQHLLTLYPPKSPSLDVACGTGILCGIAHKSGCDVTGLDITPAMLEEARRSHPEVKFVEGIAEKLPFGDETFESVYVSFALVYFTNIPGVLREIWRVLKPGGFIAFQSASGDSYIVGVATQNACVDVLGEEKARKTFRVPCDVTDTERDLNDLMENAGFRDTHINSLTTTSELDIDKVMNTWNGGVASSPFLHRVNNLNDVEKTQIWKQFLVCIEQFRGDDGVLSDKVLHWFVQAFKPLRSST